MPDSAYDTDANPAYFAIWQTTVEFHTMLKSRAELNRRTDSALDLDHFDKAMREVISILHRRSRSRTDFIWDVLAELLPIVGGGLVAPLVTELIAWLNQNLKNPFAPTSTSVLLTFIGLLLIVVKLAINYRNG
jgi:hypothetical protein